jgi:hypothetical protein
MEYCGDKKTVKTVPDPCVLCITELKPRCENADTTGASAGGISVSTLRAKQQRFLDTTDFSRVVFQFLSNFAASKKAETEPPHD